MRDETMIPLGAIVLTTGRCNNRLFEARVIKKVGNDHFFVVPCNWHLLNRKQWVNKSDIKGVIEGGFTKEFESILTQVHAGDVR